MAFEPARGVSPHRFEAEKLLRKLATDPGIVAIMTRRRYQVGRLCEMDPADDKLAKRQQEAANNGNGAGAAGGGGRAPARWATTRTPDSASTSACAPTI